MQLTDSMIEQALQDKGYTTTNPWPIIGVMGALAVIFLLCSFLHKKLIKKIVCGLLAVLMIIMGIIFISRDISKANNIKNGEWIVVTDTVDRVMVEYDRGKKSYFMVLENMNGNIALDNYDEAMQYAPGNTVYVVLIPSGNKYTDVNIAYDANKYVYVGNHQQ